MNQRNFCIGVVMVLFIVVAKGQETKLKFEGETIDGPEQDANRADWLEEMKQWRNVERNLIKYNDAEYTRPEFAWAQRNFVQPQMMVEDRYFYDVVEHKYTVDRYLDDLEKRYGGIDSVLIWAVYPNIGIDNRNQHDMLRDMPGGLTGVRQMVADFHRRGVRVLFPVMPWDNGTREEGLPLWVTAARDMAQIDADGLNGDTMEGISHEYRKASDDIGHPLVLEPECAFSDQRMLAWNNMSWGYWKYHTIPVVSRYKWVESRRMVNVCERWAKNRTDGLQSAFFNGVGYESWENIWGIWNQFTPRDAEALRRISTIERAMAEMLISPDWEPHVSTLQKGVFASRFSSQGRSLWLMVNRTGNDFHGEQIAVLHTGDTIYYDLWNGIELKPVLDGQTARLAFEIEAKGYGAILAIKRQQVPQEVKKLLTHMATLAKTSLGTLSSEWKSLPQKIVEIPPTKPARVAPEGMLLIPSSKYHFKVSGVEIEGGDGPGVDVQYPWENSPRRHHNKELDIRAFYIDKFPVTNMQFKKFLISTAYRPKDSHNFLKDWRNNTFPDGWEDKPVTWVSIEDAREYAKWAGKRLPHEWEWQYAAQGQDDRLYLWGSKEDANRIPMQENGHDLREPTNINAFSQGASPFGVMDMVGNIWQWTDEYQDEHTRAAIIRGGSYYRPAGSEWYFPRNTRLDKHGKYLLMAPCKDRSGTVGFRCVVDTE